MRVRRVFPPIRPRHPAFCRRSSFVAGTSSRETGALLKEVAGTLELVVGCVNLARTEAAFVVANRSFGWD